ncbi:hypothetical protein GCM10027605_21760 [Micromonospora zhanjiangensis]
MTGPDHRRDPADRAAVVPGADQLPVPGGDLLDRTGEPHLGRVQHDQVVADPFQVRQQVRGEQHGAARVGDAAHQRLEELASGQRVQAGDRLVEQQQPGPLGQGERQRHLGALPAGQLADRLVRRDAELGQPVAGQRVVPPLSVQLGARGDQFGGGEVPVQRGVLGDETDVGQHLPVVVRRLAEQPDRPGVGPQQPHRQVQQRALARPVGADQGGDPPRWQVQRTVPQRPCLAVPLAQPVRLQHRFHSVFLPSARTATAAPVRPGAWRGWSSPPGR